MFNWWKDRLIRSSVTKLDDHDWVEEEVIEEEVVEKVELICEGEYSFEIVKNKESFEGFLKRTVGYSHYYHYYSHHLKLNHTTKVDYNGSEFNLVGSLIIGEYGNEQFLYEELLRILKDDDTVEELNKKLKKDIVEQLEEHLKNDKIEELKALLSENNSHIFNFTFETEKTKNM